MYYCWQVTRYSKFIHDMFALPQPPALCLLYHSLQPRHLKLQGINSAAAFAFGATTFPLAERDKKNTPLRMVNTLEL